MVTFPKEGGLIFSPALQTLGIWFRNTLMCKQAMICIDTVINTLLAEQWQTSSCDIMKNHWIQSAEVKSSGSSLARVPQHTLNVGLPFAATASTFDRSSPLLRGQYICVKKSVAKMKRSGGTRSSPTRSLQPERALRCVVPTKPELIEEP